MVKVFFSLYMRFHFLSFLCNEYCIFITYGFFSFSLVLIFVLLDWLEYLFQMKEKI